MEKAETDVVDDMINALVDVLESKGILTHDEWEQRIEKKLAERVGVEKIR